MKGKVRFIATFFMIFSLLALAACGNSESSSSNGGGNDNGGGGTTQGSDTNSDNSSDNSSGSSGGVIKIGQVGPLSGDLASLGTWDKQGLAMVVSEVNKNGGINGRKLKVLNKDAQGSPSLAVNASKKLLTEGIVAAFATPSSTSTLATLPVYEQAKVPQITAGQNPQITQKGSKYVFRDTASSVTFDKTLADYVVNTMGVKKVAMISNSGSFGKGEHDAFLGALKDLGVTPVADVVINPDAKKFSAQLSTIKSKHPKVLFIGTEEVQMGLIAKQANSLGMDAQIVVGAGGATHLFVKTAGKDVANGTIFTTTYIYDPSDPQMKAFAEAYKKQYGKKADSHVAKAYDGAKMLVKAIKKAAPNIDGEHIAKAMHGLTYDGLTGHFEYDKTGEGLHKTIMGVIKNGKPTPLK